MFEIKNLLTKADVINNEFNLMTEEAPLFRKQKCIRLRLFNMRVSFELKGHFPDVASAIENASRCHEHIGLHL